MQKSVYSVVLMDEVVAAVDRLAYAASTSRSNMINRILAEYTRMDTPEQRMQDIFGAINAALDAQSILQPMLCASDAMLTMRSPLQYKYNPSVRYVVELYPHAEETLGEVRASLRTQNPTLLLYLTQFFRLWEKLEAAYLPGGPRECEYGDGRFARRLCAPKNLTGSEAGDAIADYVALLDACLKTYFEHLANPTEAVQAVERQYAGSLNAVTAQL